jgi:hypothetical protein
MGLGLMTKILVAGFAAVALLLAAGALWIRGEIRLKRVIVDQVILNAIGVGLALPWHIFMILKYRAPDGGLIRDNAFLNYFWGYHIARRMEQTEGKNLAEWYFYITEAWDRMSPFWTVLFGIAFLWALVRVARWVVQGWKQRPLNGTRSSGPPAWSEEHALLIPLTWTLFVAGITAVAQHKYKTYLVMMIPPLVLLTAQFLDRVWREGLAPWSRRLLALTIFYLAIASRVSDHFEDIVMWLRFPPDVPRVLAAVAPVLAGAAAVVLACELLARCLPKLQRMTAVAILSAIAVYGFHGGLRKNFKSKYFQDNRWSYVHELVREGDLDGLTYVGMADQPDHYFYLDGINARWRRDVDFRKVDPSGEKSVEPLPAGPKSVLIVDKYHTDKAGWTAADIETLARNYRLAHRNQHLLVYRR